MNVWTLLIEITAVLAVGAALGMLATRFGGSALIGYLVAGLILGPGGLAVVKTQHVAPVAEIGVALLLFSIGLEFSFGRLRRLGPRTLWAGVLQIALTAGLAAGLAVAFGWNLSAGIALGAILATSSTASVLRLLQERTELETVAGRTSLGILLVQDIAVVPLVLVLTLLGQSGGMDQLALGALVAIAAGGLLLAVLLVLGRLILPRFLAHASLTRNRELSILLAVVMCLAATWAAHVLKISPALGAFIAGLVLAESPFATQVRADVGSLRALFVALFFVGVGMLAQVDGFARHAAVLPLVIEAILIGKAVVIVVLLRFFRMPARHAVASGIALCQVGEFGFVLLQIATGSSLLPPAASEVLLLAIFGSLLLTPFLLPLGYPLGERAEVLLRRMGARAEAAAVPRGAGTRRDHVLVVGYGPAGQGVAAGVQRAGVPVLVIDTNPQALDLARQMDLPALIGDATYPEILEHAALGDARALVVTVPDYATVQAVLRLARTLAPQVPVVVRARYHRFAADLAEAGATHVYDEEVTSGSSMAALVQACLGETCAPRGIPAPES